MKSLVLLFACASLSACVPGMTQPASIPAPVAAAVDTVVLRGTQGLLAAEYLYNGVASEALAATRRGQITGANATRVRAINRRATAILVAGNAAQSSASKAAAATELFGIITELRALIPAR